MREIKFRAWVPSKKILCDVLTFDFIEKTAQLPIETEVNAPYWWDVTSWSFKDIKLLQYTGLKDKDGVEIYEGDIVEVYSWVSNVYRGVVKFGEYEQDASGGEYKPRPVLGFYIEALKGQLDKWGDEFLFDFEMQESIFSDLENSKVIGNIYEHPHLLEVSE